MNNARKIACPPGYMVRVTHIHDPEELAFLAMDDWEGGLLNPPRYVTLAELFRKTDDGNYEKLSEAMARCSPRDTPCRKRGYLIAHNRVLLKYFGKRQRHVNVPEIPTIPEEEMSNGVGLYI